MPLLNLDKRLFAVILTSLVFANCAYSEELANMAGYGAMNCAASLNKYEEYKELDDGTHELFAASIVSSMQGVITGALLKDDMLVNQNFISYDVIERRWRKYCEIAPEIQVAMVAYYVYREHIQPNGVKGQQ
jgi:hypothetical protein